MMKINNNGQIHKLLKRYLNNIESKSSEATGKQSDETIPARTGNSSVETKVNAISKTQDLFTENLIKILDGLNPQDRAFLINNILKSNITVDIEKITALVSYLQKNPNHNNKSIIKAFILLMKNNLPVTPELLKGTADNFNPEKSLTYKLSKLQQYILTSSGNQIADKQAGKDNPLLNILKQLTINPTDTGENLVAQLKEYPDKLSNLIQVLQQTDITENNLLQGRSDNDIHKLFQQLIGQQIINHQNKNILIQLELPLYFPQYNKSIPGYLSIKHDQKKKSDNSTSLKRNYRIDFIISLQKRGIIKAETYLSKNRIKIYFTCNKENTTELINSRFKNLKKVLEETGMKVENPVVQLVKLKEEDINDMIYEDSNLNAHGNKDFIHIDIKV